MGGCRLRLAGRSGGGSGGSVQVNADSALIEWTVQGDDVGSNEELLEVSTTDATQGITITRSGSQLVVQDGGWTIATINLGFEAETLEALEKAGEELEDVLEGVTEVAAA